MSNQKITQVFITTAKPLEKDQLALLKQLIGKKLGDTFTIKENVDKNSLGGIKIKIGSQEYDATIAGKLKKLQAQTPVVEIATATGLTSKQKTKLQTSLNNRLGENFVIEEIIDESLIGGLRLKINDKEYDGTIRNQLNKIHHQIKKHL